jgi:hypothetical protein
LANNILAVPDYSKRFRVRWDASCDGKGHAIYQLKDESKADRVGNRAYIRYASKVWKANMRARPPYYLEGDAMVDAIEDGSRYARATRFPLWGFGDQAPLQWVKHCAKGPLNAWRIERLQECEYEIFYTPGTQNVADPISRYPMLGPRQFTRIGLENAVKSLLTALPTSLQAIEKAWVWANHDTAEVAREVQQWRTATGAIHTRHPKEALTNKAWGLGILMPRADQATAMAAMALRGSRPICVLVPTDVVHLIAQATDGSRDDALQEVVEKATKVQLMAPLHTWVIANVPEAKAAIYIGEGGTTPPSVGQPHVATLGTLEQWMPEQRAAMAEEANDYRATSRTRADGLVTVVGKDERERIYVPPPWRMELYRLVHESIGHLAAAKTYAELWKTYHWPTMRKDTRAWYHDCDFCELSKAKRHFANKQWGATKASPPRSRWGMDFYGMPDCDILGMIDLDSLWVELAACPSRKAGEAERAVERHILFRHGVPDMIKSDHAKEFVGRVMSQLAAYHRFEMKSTGGYMPQGNSTMERFWNYFALCLRQLSDEEYEDITRHLPAIAWGWNSTVSDSLSVRPFEVMSGASPRGPGDAVIARQQDPTATLQIGSIRASASEFIRIAAAHGDHMRRERQALLNRHDRTLRALDVNDYVKMFIPPTQEEAARRGRKVKHMLRWRGPMRITARPSPTTFELVGPSGRKFMRHLANVRPWRGRIPEASDTPLLEPPELCVQDIQTDEFVFASDAPDSPTYYLAKVVNVNDHHPTIQMFGTTTKHLKRAKFTPVYTRGKDIVLRRYSQVPGAKPWKWEILIDDMDALILARGIKLSKNGHLSAQSRRVVTQLTPRELVVFS